MRSFSKKLFSALSVVALSASLLPGIASAGCASVRVVADGRPYTVTICCEGVGEFRFCQTFIQVA